MYNNVVKGKPLFVDVENNGILRELKYDDFLIKNTTIIDMHKVLELIPEQFLTIIVITPRERGKSHTMIKEIINKYKENGLSSIWVRNTLYEAKQEAKKLFFKYKLIENEPILDNVKRVGTNYYIDNKKLVEVMGLTESNRGTRYLVNYVVYDEINNKMQFVKNWSELMFNLVVMCSTKQDKLISKINITTRHIAFCNYKSINHDFFYKMNIKLEEEIEYYYVVDSEGNLHPSTVVIRRVEKADTNQIDELIRTDPIYRLGVALNLSQHTYFNETEQDETTHVLNYEVDIKKYDNNNYTNFLISHEDRVLGFRKFEGINKHIILCEYIDYENLDYIKNHDLELIYAEKKDIKGKGLLMTTFLVLKIEFLDNIIYFNSNKARAIFLDWIQKFK